MRKGFTLIELMIVIAIIAIIAAIAIPNLLESRVTANEAAASASLKSGVFPGQVQFQGGGYLDRDADNVGEYGTLGMLTGAAGTPKIASGQIKLVTGPMATGGATAATRSANGYEFVGVAPSETNATSQAIITYIIEGTNLAASTTILASANGGERGFAVGCGPDRYSDTGRRVFLVSQDGQIRSPALKANQDVWMTTTAPIGSTDATILAGLGNAFAAGAITATTTTDLSSVSTAYPTYSR